MQRISELHRFPIIIIAVGTAAVIVGTVMLALQDQKLQRREGSDDLLLDNEEVDTCSAEITADNQAQNNPWEPTDVVDISSVDLRVGSMEKAPDVYVETVWNECHIPDESTSSDGRAWCGLRTQIALEEKRRIFSGEDG